MRKLSYVLAALVGIGVGVPTLVSATEVGVQIGGHHRYYRDYRGPRAEFYEHDRGLHRGWYHHPGVVIRHHYSAEY